MPATTRARLEADSARNVLAVLDAEAERMDGTYQGRWWRELAREVEYRWPAEAGSADAERLEDADAVGELSALLDRHLRDLPAASPLRPAWTAARRELGGLRGEPLLRIVGDDNHQEGR